MFFILTLSPGNSSRCSIAIIFTAGEGKSSLRRDVALDEHEAVVGEVPGVLRVLRDLRSDSGLEARQRGSGEGLKLPSVHDITCM